MSETTTAETTKVGSDSKTRRKNPIREVLGFGYLVQGLRCYPWMAVIFFLKDGLKVDPSMLQLLQNSANLPMVGKPLYGVVSDAVYIGEQHRLPYIAFGAFLQAVSWLAIAILPTSSISLFTITLCLLASNLGAAICEVANDAIVAETGKQSSESSTSKSKSKSKPSEASSASSSSSGELQSFVWIASSLGGVIGNLIGGVTINRFSPQKMFLFYGLLVAVQFFIIIVVRETSLKLPKSKSTVGIKKQLSDLAGALRKPEIGCSIAWFAASYAVIPLLTGTMFFYQTQHLKIDSSVIGLSKVFGQAAMLLWSVIYNRKLKSIPPRKLISAIQITMAVSMVMDTLFVNHFFRNFGLPDSAYVVIFSGLAEVLFFFKILPFSIVISQLCPAGCEGSLIAFLMSAVALAFIVSGYLGIALASYVGEDFSGLPWCLLIQAACTILPLFWSSYVPDQAKLKAKKKSS